jgi:pimeloyl-ACP methyl ester carboxylesterase
MRPSIRRVVRVVATAALLIGILAVTAFIILFSNPYRAEARSAEALRSDDTVTVSDNPNEIIFMPANPAAGFIYYPGARVEPAAYAPVMRQIAAQGYAVFVIKVPLNFALFSVNRADDFIAAYPQITAWAVGGHSLGGVAACAYAAGGTKAQALIMHASFCANGIADRTDLEIVSIYATLDAFSNVERVESNKGQFPADATWIKIEGGNHSQFGDYGLQSGDNVATISADEQYAQIVAATIEALQRISEN